MPDDEEARNLSQDISPNLGTVFTVPKARIDTLRSEARLAAPAAATSTAASMAGAQTRPVAGAAARRAAEKYEVPNVVLAIGLYEFLRAVALGLMYATALGNPPSMPLSHTFWTFFFVLSNGAPRVSVFLPLTIVYALAIGTCLWFKVNWGRRVLIATSFWAVFRLAAFMVGYTLMAARASAAQMEELSYLKGAAFMLAALNIVIGLYLSYAPGVAEAFGQQK